jgi:hypothetical protein
VGDGVGLAQHLVIPEPKSPEILRTKKCIAPRIILVVRMLRAVGLDNQALR